MLPKGPAIGARAAKSEPALTGEAASGETTIQGIPGEIYPDSSGVYGYLPKPGTFYAKLDFTDPIAVARNRKIREIYFNGSDVLEEAISSMKSSGYSSERIGHRAVWQRNSEKLESRAYMLPEEIEDLEARNLAKYKHPLGPTPQEMYNKYGDWDVVIKKSMEKDPAINMLLGLPPKR